MVSIDAAACIGCGRCVKDCIEGNLLLREKRAEVKGDCFLCGHCAAICPQKAVTISEYDMEDVEEFSPELFSLEAERLLKAIKFRRSIRDYRVQPVEAEKLEYMLQAGRYTATAKNTQECCFIFVQRDIDELKRQVWSEIGRALSDSHAWAEPYRRFFERHEQDSKEDYLFRNAPAVLFIAAERELDAGLAAQNMELMAVAEGLGVLYNGYLRRAAEAAPSLREWLGTGSKPLAACMLLGYPAVKYSRTAPRRKAQVIWR